MTELMPARTCADPSCGRSIDHLRADAQYCPGGACKQRAFRQRKRLAGGISAVEPQPGVVVLHDAAIELLAERPDEFRTPSERLALLQAVVWPADERLRAAA